MRKIHLAVVTGQAYGDWGTANLPLAAVFDLTYRATVDWTTPGMQNDACRLTGAEGRANAFRKAAAANGTVRITIG